MIEALLKGHDYKYGIDEIINLFDDNSLYYKVESILELSDEITAITKVYDSNLLMSEVRVHEKALLGDLRIRKQSKRLLKMSLFKALKKLINKEIPWGILTGIRPTKIVHEMMKNNITEDAIINILAKEYEVGDEKAKLLILVAKYELQILEKTPKNSISLYIGIPFCPTRCLYCSFTSNSAQECGHLMLPYIDALIKEMEFVSSIIKQKGWAVQSLYFGGGTPSTLEMDQLRRLLEKADKLFDFKKVEEITFEAGRPDTIDKDKLELIKGFGIHRISINPQTMNKQTLDLIQRRHSPENIVDAFNLARKVGFNNINMDIIIGLPGEDCSHLTKTMEEILKLNPENLTVHTMAIKRASNLKEEIANYSLKEAEIIKDMLNISKAYARKMGMHPYYMYRQKNMLGNFENVGFCKPGYEGIYNIQIMEEHQTIIALGAGGISKVVDPDKNRIERIFNVKNVEEYINRIEQMIERKKVLH